VSVAGRMSIESDLAEQIQLKHLVMQERDLIKTSALKLADDLRLARLELARVNDKRNQLADELQKYANTLATSMDETREARNLAEQAKNVLRDVYARLDVFRRDYGL